MTHDQRLAELEAENAVLRRALARDSSEHHGKLKPFYPLVAEMREQGKSYQTIADEIISRGTMATKAGVRHVCAVLGCAGVRAKPGRPKLNESERDRMRRVRRESPWITYADLGARFGVCEATALKVCKEAT